MERFDIDKTIKILGLDIHAEQADEGRDFDVACRIAVEKMRKCKEYEDAEEQGLLLRLPISIGDIVYRVNEYAENPIILMGVVSVEIKGITDTFKEIKCKECLFGGEFTYRFTDFGKIVFLTREEAEQALAEMKVE